MITIIQKDDPRLRNVAAPVPPRLIGTPTVAAIIKKMKKALLEQDDGVAIAAPQIGESLRIFIVSGRVFTRNYPDLAHGQKIEPDLICINPVITKLSKQKKKVPEGCLSVRWLYGDVWRSVKASLRALDEQGKPFIRGASGLLAQVFQHEMDHLDGVLFTDKAENVQNIPPENQKEDQKAEGRIENRKIIP
jgi:peptide deformylase